MRSAEHGFFEASRPGISLGCLPPSDFLSPLTLKTLYHVMILSSRPLNMIASPFARLLSHPFAKGDLEKIHRHLYCTGRDMGIVISYLQDDRANRHR